MKAAAAVTVIRRNGRTVIADLRSEPPIALRETATGVAIVGSAAGPVGGDDVSLTVDVGAGACLRIGAVATSMVWPGPVGQASRQTLRIVGGEGGHLEWTGQPLLVVQGADHIQRVNIDLGNGATIDFTDELALGRSGETTGRLDTRMRVVRDGAALLDQHQIHDATGSAWTTTAGVGDHRHITHRLVVGPPARPVHTSTCRDTRSARFALADDVELTITLGSERAAPARATLGV